MRDTRGTRGSERGFTLVEVLAAIAILLIGVLGVAALATGANKTTTRTKSNEAAVALARDMLETAHAVPYAELTAGRLENVLKVQLPDADPGASGWQVQRRGVTYTVSASLCVLDDPKDGMGAHDSSYCGDTGAAGAADLNPSDYKRVTLALAWRTDAGSQSTSQSTLITNSDRGPVVTSIDTNPPGATTVTSGTNVSFTLTTSVPPAKIEWYLDGAFQQSVGGNGPVYSFNWNAGSPCGTNSVIDGTYVVSAQAFNVSDSSPGPRGVTVRMNRCLASAPTSLAGGRNRWGVELNWEDSKEDDVIGYRVFRGIGTATPAAIASGPCSGVVKASTCIEPDPASTQTLVYNVRAVDRDSTGAERNGPASANVSVVTGNKVPATPAIGNAGSYGTIGWYAVSDPDKTDSVDFYRIYRDGQTLAHRYDVIDAVGDPIVWSDTATGGATHTYYVVAVDTRLGESGFSNAVTR